MNQGLAEYTNANFFSEDTMFAAEANSSDPGHFFAYPAKNETNVQDFIDGTLRTTRYYIHEGVDIGPPVTGFTITKLNTGGEKLDCIAKPGPYTKEYFNERGEGSAFYGSFVQDDKCFEAQAGYLFPRAVAYSKALLDYFFRGKITLAKAGENSTSSITLTATNATADNEPMSGGTVELVLRYRMTENNDTLFAIPEGGDYLYKVVPYPGCTDAAGNGICTIPTGGKNFTFDLANDPVPSWANDVTAQLVYRGQLGIEAGAVAVGSLPLEVKPKAILISLPPSGAYASSDGTQPFKRITLKARSELADGLNTPEAQFQP